MTAQLSSTCKPYISSPSGGTIIHFQLRDGEAIPAQLQIYRFRRLFKGDCACTFNLFPRPGLVWLLRLLSARSCFDAVAVCCGSFFPSSCISEASSLVESLFSCSNVPIPFLVPTSFVFKLTNSLKVTRYIFLEISLPSQIYTSSNSHPAPLFITSITNSPRWRIQLMSARIDTACR